MKERKLRENYTKILYIDDREPLKFAELVAMNATIPVEFKRMKTGDYVCEEVAIERKQISDFASSIISKKKRLWKQVDRLKKEYTYPYLFISGKLKEVYAEVTDHAMLGSMAYCMCPKFDEHWTEIEKAIPVCWVDTDKHLAYLILKTMERHGKLKLPTGKDLVRV